MTRAQHAKAHWLIPCALVGALLSAVPAGAADDPREWLEKMNKALSSRNYDGTFFHISGGRVETMRIVHRVRSGRVSERLQSLDGSGREFVRANDEVTATCPINTPSWSNPARIAAPSKTTAMRVSINPSISTNSPTQSNASPMMSRDSR